MTRKKKSQGSLANSPTASSGGGESSFVGAASQQQTPARSEQTSKSPGSSGKKDKAKGKSEEPSTSALIICRNKHWRYISSFHGPWLQLPPDILESLAYSNYASPRPQPIDPAVFFDLVKIRRLIEEATDLAVRAANGTTSSALSNSMNASNGLLSGGSSAMLGLGLGGSGSTARLSRERRHRMREHATQKLSKAYYLDEIAASVATMQSASALEDVARLVLQREEDDPDAKYVHFFHEKIPSRCLAECTSLKPLDDVIAVRPREGSVFRTRAITRVFKEDYIGAAKDLTEGLSTYRMHQAQHTDRQRQLQLAAAESQRRTPLSRDYRSDFKIDEKDQPTGLETQLLFHRAGVYLTIACQHINIALDALKKSQSERTVNTGPAAEETGSSPTLSPAGKEAYRRWLEARKIVKTNARRALRDYTSFLSHLDYTPGLSPEVAETFLQKVNAASSGYGKYRGSRAQGSRLLEIANQPTTQSRTGTAENERSVGGSHDGSHDIPSTEVYQLSTLFSAQPPANLPPYPPDSTALVPAKQNSGLGINTTDSDAAMVNYGCYEAVTYHPLLTDALHSLLLCHSLVQTSPKEHLRHAHMVARLARICDGYPIFLAPRSPARADWMEVIHRANNWIGLKQSWEQLCAPAPLPGQQPPTGQRKKDGGGEADVGERRKQDAIMDALADERVQDEESFKSAVRAHEKRAEERGAAGSPAATTTPAGPAASHSQAGPAPKRWAQEDGKEYLITSERSEAIARWILESPVSTGEGGTKGKSKRGPKKTRSPEETIGDSPSLETSVHDLSVNE